MYKKSRRNNTMARDKGNSFIRARFRHNKYVGTRQGILNNYS